MMIDTDAADRISGKKNTDRSVDCSHLGSLLLTSTARNNAIDSCRTTVTTTNRIVLTNDVRSVGSLNRLPKLLRPAHRGALMTSHLKKASTTDAMIGTSVKSPRPMTVGARKAIAIRFSRLRTTDGARSVAALSRWSAGFFAMVVIRGPREVSGERSGGELRGVFMASPPGLG